MGGLQPLGIKVSWGSSSEEGGAAHGPLHPALLTSKLLGLCFDLGVRTKVFAWFLSRYFVLGKCVCVFEPFKLRAVFRLLVLVLSGPVWVGGASSQSRSFRRQE